VAPENLNQKSNKWPAIVLFRWEAAKKYAARKCKWKIAEKERAEGGLEKSQPVRLSKRRERVL